MTHHVWCNRFMFIDDNCPMCKRLREDFAEDGALRENYLDQARALLEKHFPDAKPIPYNQLGKQDSCFVA